MSAPGADPLAAVRQRDVAAELVMRRKRGTYLPHDDVLAWQNLSSMLALWDTRESALRALVAQMRQEMDARDAAEKQAMSDGVTAAAAYEKGRQLGTALVVGQLERLLSGPQP